jgi:hypothetical protein
MDLQTRAELTKLARALGTAPERVEFLAGLPVEDLRRLRERVSAALFDRHRGGVQRMAAASRILPVGVLARIAERAMPPMLSARIAGEMAPERAAELATRLGAGYLAEVCVELDPRAAGPIVQRLPVEVVVGVAAELLRRGDHLTIGRFVDAAPDEVIRAVVDGIEDDADLLRIATYVEHADQLERLVGVLPEPRVKGLVRAAVDGPPELQDEVTSLLGRVNDDLAQRLAALLDEPVDKS